MKYHDLSSLKAYSIIFFRKGINVSALRYKNLTLANFLFNIQWGSYPLRVLYLFCVWCVHLIYYRKQYFYMDLH